MFRPILATVQNIHETTHVAAEHATAQGAEVVHHMSFVDYIFHSNVINIILVAIFVVWLCKKANIIGILKSRQEQVKQNIIKAEESKIDAEKKLEEAKENVKDLDKKTAQIMSDAENSALSMSEKIKQDTEQKIEEIEKNLQKTIKVEEKSAAEEILKGASKEAFEIASSKIKDALNDELHHKYITNFIDSIDEAKVK